MSAIHFPRVLCAASRAPRGRGLLGPRDETSLRELLEQHGGRDSFGCSRMSAATHRAAGGVALASGDPIGDPEAWPGATEPWPEEAREHGWTPAVLGASEEGEAIYARHGLDALETGDKAIHRHSDNGLTEHTVMQFAQRAHQLDRADAKYRPVWKPRHPPSPTTGEPPRTSSANTRAEGFLTARGLTSLLRRRHRTSTAGQL
ncbi:phosphatidylglycerol lysyltransferase domain-containing protein [Streptomyces sp. NPDC020096]